MLSRSAAGSAWGAPCRAGRWRLHLACAGQWLLPLPVCSVQCQCMTYVSSKSKGLHLEPSLMTSMHGRTPGSAVIGGRVLRLYWCGRVGRKSF